MPDLTLLLPVHRISRTHVRFFSGIWAKRVLCTLGRLPLLNLLPGRRRKNFSVACLLTVAETEKGAKNDERMEEVERKVERQGRKQTIAQCSNSSKG